MRYREYPAYKESGVEWLGAVPEGWEVLPLKYTCSYNDETLSGKTPPDYQIEYVDISSVDKTSGISKTETLSYKKSPSRARRIVRDGDIIISTVRTYLEAIARIQKPPGNLIVSTGFAVVRPQRNFYANFAFYAVRCRYFIESIVAYSVGISYPAINASELVRLHVVAPPYSEQTAIAKFLDRETPKIDNLIAKQQELIELLQEKRQAAISHAVTKGLNPEVKMKDSGVDWLGEVPEHWKVGKLRFFANIQGGIAKGRKYNNQKTISVPYLRVANVQDGFLDLTNVYNIEILPSELKRYLLQDGDVLMNEGGDNDKLGRGAVWKSELTPCIHQNHVFAVRPKGIESLWLSTVTQASYAKFYFFSVAKQSTNLASISSTNIKRLQIVVPPTAEREKILKYIELQCKKIDVLIAKASAAILLIQERRTALISAAVTGKIDVRNPD